VTRAYSGRLARGLETDFLRRHDDQAPAAYPEVHHLTVPLRRASARAERPDLLALWAGTGWRSARAVPAATVVAELAR
jgi:nitronate monooxygenase